MFNCPLFFNSRVPYLHDFCWICGCMYLCCSLQCPNALASESAPHKLMFVPQRCGFSSLAAPCTDHLLAGVQDLASSRRDAVLSGLARYHDAVSRVTSGSVKPGFDGCCFLSKASPTSTAFHVFYTSFQEDSFISNISLSFSGYCLI